LAPLGGLRGLMDTGWGQILASYTQAAGAAQAA
jgi:hypothetical protein